MSDSTETASAILREESEISIQEIKDKIIDMHKNIKLCIDTEFNKDPSQVLEFSQIVRLCVGENYSILLRFYEE